MRVFAEVFAPPAILLMVGAGHVSMPLATLGREMGFRTIVIDGRPRFATRERFPDVDDLKIGIPSELVQKVPLIATTALVLVAHDYKYDVPVLRHALATPVGYIGLLGSSRRGAAILEPAARGRRRRGGARSACACPSVSIWARSRRPRSRSASWPRS